MEYTVGTKVFGDWEIVREIGEGSYGKVFELKKSQFGITSKSAMKLIRIPKTTAEIREVLSEGMDEQTVTSYFRDIVERFIREIAIMSEVKGHPHIVACEDYAVQEHEGSVGWDILVRMELLTSFSNYLLENQMTEEKARQLGIEICEALDFCQQKGLIHRDIKPGNIFVDSWGRFKLGDFGVARTLEGSSSGMSKQGTEHYMAPEVFYMRPYGANVDVYSLGIVLYRLMNENRLPFWPDAPAPVTFTDKMDALTKRVRGEKLPRPLKGSDAFVEVILKACEADPKERYRTAGEMMDALQGTVNSILDSEPDPFPPPEEDLNVYKELWITAIKDPRGKQIDIDLGDKKIRTEISLDAKQGDVVRIPGEGKAPSLYPAHNGDLVLTIMFPDEETTVNPFDLNQGVDYEIVVEESLKEELDVYKTIWITEDKDPRGKKAEIQWEGSRIQLTIPENIANGSSFKVRQKGKFSIMEPGKRGDLIIAVMFLDAQDLMNSYAYKERLEYTIVEKNGSVKVVLKEAPREILLKYFQNNLAKLYDEKHTYVEPNMPWVIRQNAYANSKVFRVKKNELLGAVDLYTFAVNGVYVTEKAMILVEAGPIKMFPIFYQMVSEAWIEKGKTEKDNVLFIKNVNGGVVEYKHPKLSGKIVSLEAVAEILNDLKKYFQ